jgi:hypothetical protein
MKPFRPSPPAPLIEGPRKERFSEPDLKPAPVLVSRQKRPEIEVIDAAAEPRGIDRDYSACGLDFMSPITNMDFNTIPLTAMQIINSTEPASISMPSKNATVEVDARLLSCKPICGVLALEFEGRKPIGIKVPSNSTFQIKVYSGDGQPGTIANPKPLAAEISGFCQGKTISMIAVDSIHGQNLLAISTKEAGVLVVTSDKPITFRPIPDC